jgi:hypothetical protein
VAKQQQQAATAAAAAEATVVWVDPKELVPNAANAKQHPPEQMATLADLLARNGWVKPLVVNTRTGLMIDGHARLQLVLSWGELGRAERLGRTDVPVWYGDWTEAQEAELLAFLDESGRQATIDPGKFAALKAKLASLHADGSPLARLRLSIENSPLFQAQSGLRASFPGGGRTPGLSGEDGATAPAPAPAQPMLAVDELRPHPRDYVACTDEQVGHVAEGLRQSGPTRTVTAARDGTVLSEYVVVLAARSLGLASVPGTRLDLEPDDPRALKILASNGRPQLADIDDRALAELLKDVKDRAPGGLAGTGYDEKMLANLVFVTRPESEVADFDAAAHWVGMPEYDPGEEAIQVIVNFRSEDDREKFVAANGLLINKSKGGKSTWWPPRERQDLSSVIFEG